MRLQKGMGRAAGGGPRIVASIASQQERETTQGQVGLADMLEADVT